MLEFNIIIVTNTKMNGKGNSGGDDLCSQEVPELCLEAGQRRLMDPVLGGEELVFQRHSEVTQTDLFHQAEV